MEQEREGEGERRDEFPNAVKERVIRFIQRRDRLIVSHHFVCSQVKEKGRNQREKAT